MFEYDYCHRFCQEDKTLRNEDEIHKAIYDAFLQQEVRRNRERVEEIIFITSNNEKEINNKLYIDEEDEED